MAALSDPVRRRARTGEPIRAEDIARLQDALAPAGGALLGLFRPIGPVPMAARIVALSAAGTLGAGELADDWLHVEVLETAERLDVLKPYTLRPSVTSRAGVSFTYASAQARTATQDATSQDQALTPSYAIGDEITIAPLARTDGVVWRDCNDDGRQWAVVEE